MIPPGMKIYAGLCGWTLARAHARSGDRVALAACLGGSGAFDQAIGDFAESLRRSERGDWRSLVMETVLTAILVSIILNTATGGRSIGHNAAIAVGSTVALLGLFASPISGASMNPARTLGPDIVGNDYTGWWVYIAGPVIGAAIAVMIIGAVRGLPDKEEREAAQGGALPVTAAPAADGH